MVAVFRAYADPAEVPKQGKRIAREWLQAADLHRDRQLERVGDDEDARQRVEKEYAARKAETEDARDAVLEWLKGDTAPERFASVVELSEIAEENDYNLNISRYVDSSEPPPELDVAEELARLREVEKERNKAEKQMDKLLTEIGYTV